MGPVSRVCHHMTTKARQFYTIVLEYLLWVLETGNHDHFGRVAAIITTSTLLSIDWRTLAAWGIRRFASTARMEHSTNPPYIIVHNTFVFNSLCHILFSAASTLFSDLGFPINTTTPLARFSLTHTVGRTAADIINLLHRIIQGNYAAMQGSASRYISLPQTRSRRVSSHSRLSYGYASRPFPHHQRLPYTTIHDTHG